DYYCALYMGFGILLF
nr:immunoglobulin light chain junction region [Macaca mulatta]MOX18628.1 immunoglobulin light chain junction region [Macaca mulatta]MOX18968.1 immunoglobulin light chain junction region [Macaca mulatta]MOX20456.1 immunoglobulin light chain junction region [Macaca mulatta]MOX20775.1 immunoglobulin light chain junction region [Macaca mulatta]